MTEAVKDDAAIIYTDRREFLIASVSDTRNRYETEHADQRYYGFAATELQFRRALCDFVFPAVDKLSRVQLQALMADELKTMGDE